MFSIVLISGNNLDVQSSLCVCVFSDLQACVLSSVELQVLTGSCFKLRTVHNIPVTSNKDGKRQTALCSLIQCLVASTTDGGIKCKYYLNKKLQQRRVGLNVSVISIFSCTDVQKVSYIQKNFIKTVQLIPCFFPFCFQLNSFSSLSQQFLFVLSTHYPSFFVPPFLFPSLGNSNSFFRNLGYSLVLLY